MLYTSNALPNLTLDEMLVIEGLSHRKYRDWLKLNDKPLYSLTRGLQDELNNSSNSRTELSKLYYLTHLEVNACIYGTKASLHNLLKKERANQLRNSGSTELDLLNEDLPIDTELLSKEITARRKNKESIAYLATLYGYTTSRISQLDNNAATRPPRLTPQQKEEIRLSDASAQELAKRYNTTVNTIYVTRREK